MGIQNSGQWVYCWSALINNGVCGANIRYENIPIYVSVRVPNPPTSPNPIPGTDTNPKSNPNPSEGITRS